MQDLHNIYLELQLELVKNFVVYIPTILSENGFLDEIANEVKVLHDIEIDLTKKDKLLLFDTDLKLIVSPKLQELQSFYLKNASLQKNCFKFMELSQKLSDDNFDYLYLNYFNRLNNYLLASGYLLEIFESNCPKEIISKKSIFEIQHSVFLDHLEDLQKTIDYIYNNPKNEEEDVLNDNENNSNVLNKSNSKTNKSENSQITKKEAIDYLLANVFTSKNKT